MTRKLCRRPTSSARRRCSSNRVTSYDIAIGSPPSVEPRFEPTNPAADLPRMANANAPTNESATQAIERLGLLSKSGDPTLRAITRLAGYIAGGSSAGVHIIDDQVQHRIAGHNAPEAGHPRADAMCPVAADSGQTVASEDATKDPRFDYASFVQGDDPGVRLYVAAPLEMADGVVVGTLCAWNSTSAPLNNEQVAAFDDLAVVAAAVLQQD